MAINDQPDLLFFDTFAHDNSEELNLDLVQFPKSVFVREIRIIPLGARVQGDFPGGVRLGATNPTQFHIDFFVNDLSKPGACTFEALGSLEYSQNGSIHMECITSVEKPSIPTDGLVLRGCYTTITLAVYGNLTQPTSDIPTPTPSLPRDVPIPTAIPPPQEWNPETTTTIPTYTATMAVANPEYQGAYAPENYDPQMYRPEYYDENAPKDPRTYHHMEDTEWEKREPSCERVLSPRLEIERDRELREGRSRRRSLDRRSRESSRHRDHSRGERRSRSREYVVKGEYRHSRSRSRSVEHVRAPSSDRDWEHYKKDEYRRPRDASFDRSRAGSYDKRSGSYEHRSSSYDKRAPSYERKAPYEKRSPYEKRAPSYERRASSYEKQLKRLSPYNRVRDTSYGSRSPSRDDPRKRPRTPPRGLSREGSPPPAPRQDEGTVEYDRNGKPIPRVDFYQSYRHKSSIRSPSQEAENASFVETHNSTLVTVPIVDNIPPKPHAIESPLHNQEEDTSMEESFEPILSDEDICDDPEPPFMDMDYDANDYCEVEDIIKYYNPFKVDWVKYDYENKIYLLKVVKEDNGKDVLSANFDELSTACPDLMKIYEMTKTSNKRESEFSPSTFLDIENSFREEWVQKCEQLCLLVTNICKETDIIFRILNNSNKSNDEFADIYNLLVTFTKIGLNFNLALVQHVSTYKIRHIKCGIRLAEALVSHKYNGEVVKGFLKSGINISQELLELYLKEHMALSIRLMILKALNGCLSSKVAVENFMLPSLYPKFNSSDNENRPKNGYQVLISIMQSNPLARVKFAISSLIKKLNMYELLDKINKLVMNFNIICTENEKGDEVELSDTEIEFIVNSLDEILHMYRTQCFHMSQPKRFLPVNAQFDISKDCSNEILLEFFKEHHFLDVCLYLLTSPTTCNNLVIVSPIHDLIFELVHSHNGLKFLYKNMSIAELFFKTLNSQQNLDEFLYHHDLSNYTDLQILSFEMAHRLKAMSCIEAICDLQMGSYAENDLVDRLQELFCLSFGNIGKLSVPNIIVMDVNVECLIEVLERDTRPKNKNESPSKHKSPAKGYAIDLIVAAVKFSSDVPFLKKYGARIFNIVKEHDKFEPSVSSLLQELIPYLKPIENANLLNGEDFSECVEILKNNMEAAPDVPGELVTSLRILRHYCISDYEKNVTIACDTAIEEYIELKYKYNVLQLFSLDGISHICAILDRLAIHFDLPSMHSSCFASVKGLHVAQIILPALRLVDDMLARVVKCRGSKFRDLTAAPVLLKSYGLVRAFPPGCVAYRTGAKAAEAAVRALLAYAQPAADDASGGDSIKHGPWTSLCSEVINYTMTAPHTFVPGLLIFSELLPLPLPVHSKIAPTERELSDASNERRLWSAHLYALGNDLVDMIQIICMSTFRPAVHMLRRVCVQIADLAPNTAATVARAAVGAVTRELASGGPASSSASRVLGFLAFLVGHAPVKCAVLHTMSSGGPKSGEILTAICNVLSLNHTSTEHSAAQEFAAHALAGFCDAEVTLTPCNGNTESIISNSLPSKETLASFLEASADCVGATKNCTVASSILRAFFVLTEHEYGFQQFRKILPKKKDCFDKFFKWLVEGSGEETLECLSLFIDLLRILCSEEGEGPLGRKSMLSVTELADLVGYPGNDSEHVAMTLENNLKQKNADEDVLVNASFLCSYLSKPAPPRPPSPPGSPPPAAPLVQQFASRPVHSDAAGGDARLTSGYWLAVPELAEDEGGEDMVMCDISEVARGLVGGAAGLLGALRGLAGLAPTLPDTAARGTHVSVSGGRVLSVCDTFRSRPPNTSRPPSLHVDDFTARQLAPNYVTNRGVRRGSGTDRGRFASQTPHLPLYRHMRGRGAWEMGGQHFGHFPPAGQYMMGQYVFIN